MNEVLKKLENLLSSSLDKNLDSDSIHSLKLKMQIKRRLLITDQPQKKVFRYYIEPRKYGIPFRELRMYPERYLLRKEIEHIFDDDDIMLPKRLNNKLFSLFKTALIESFSPTELYVSERDARLIFDVPLRRLNLYRETDLIKVAKYKGSYCYSWTQLQELFG